jgi:hypothetical protein
MHANLAAALDALQPDTWVVEVQVMSHDDLMTGCATRRLQKRHDRAVRLHASVAGSAHEAVMLAVAMAHRGPVMPLSAQLVSWPASHDLDASDFGSSDWLASLD